MALALGVTEAEIAGVLSFYPDVGSAPAGCHVIGVCMCESCMANQWPAVFRAVEGYVRLKIGETKGNAFTLEKVYCMGNCALSPTLVVDEDIYGRVQRAQVPALLERYR